MIILKNYENDFLYYLMNYYIRLFFIYLSFIVNLIKRIFIFLIMITNVYEVVFSFILYSFINLPVIIHHNRYAILIICLLYPLKMILLNSFEMELINENLECEKTLT